MWTEQDGAESQIDTEDTLVKKVAKVNTEDDDNSCSEGCKAKFALV